MKRLVHTLALGAALVALALGIWRDYGAFTALKRATIAYLATYFAAGGLGLTARLAVNAVRDPEPVPADASAKGRSRRMRRPSTEAAAPAPESGETAAEADKDPAKAPVPAHAG